MTWSSQTRTLLNKASLRRMANDKTDYNFRTSNLLQKSPHWWPASQVKPSMTFIRHPQASPTGNASDQFCSWWWTYTSGLHSVQQTFALLNECSERSLNESKWQIGAFAIANKNCGTHRILSGCKEYLISLVHRIWVLGNICDTWPFAKRWSFSEWTAVANRK